MLWGLGLKRNEAASGAPGGGEIGAYFPSRSLTETSCKEITSQSLP